jgi:hypothetical protein
VSSFGGYGHFPFTFGGGDEPTKTYHKALLEEYEGVFNTELDSLPEIEAYAEAAMLAHVPNAAGRLANQRIPPKMTTALPKWEEACHTQPTANQSLEERQAEVAAKLRGLGPNAEPDIADACAALLGEHFVGVHYVDASEEITYYPGANPGPPGQEWASNVRHAFVQVRPLAKPLHEFRVLLGRLERMLGDMLPSDMKGDWYVHNTIGGVDGFYLDVSLLDVTGL